MKEYITLQEVNKAFLDAGIEIVDNRDCIGVKNHIHTNVKNYLKSKWEDKKDYKDHELFLKEQGVKLLKELDE